MRSQTALHLTHEAHNVEARATAAIAWVEVVAIEDDEKHAQLVFHFDGVEEVEQFCATLYAAAVAAISLRNSKRDEVAG